MSDSIKRDWLIWDSRTFNGDAMTFWASGRRGYTQRLEHAGRYTEEEAKKQAASRDTDYAVPVDIALRHTRTIVATGRIYKDLTDAGLPNPVTAERDRKNRETT